MGKKKLRHLDKIIFGKNLESNHYNFPKEEAVSDTQFELIYDNNNYNYKVKDINYGTGLFLSIKTRQVIDLDYIISFCNTHMLVYKLNNSNILKFKFLQGILKDKVFTYNPVENPNVKIGRDKKNEVVYKDDSVSRVQCSFVYEDNFWYVYDGIPSKPSTNGIWILASKYFNLDDGMLLKTGNTTFSVKLR